MNRAVVATSLVRRHVVFKFFNYVTDKIIRVVITTLPLMLRCVQTKCVSVRERPRNIRLCAFRTYNEILWQKHGKICRFYHFVYSIYLFGQCLCGFWLFFCYKTFEITEIIWKEMYRTVMRSKELPGTTFAVANLRTFVSQSDSSIQRPVV